MNEQFKDFLERDETIIKVFKPNKKKFWFEVHFLFFISTFWLYICLLGAIPEDGEVFDPWLLLWIALGVTGFIVICGIITVIFASKSYKNTAYAYKNKRLIARSGYFGVNFFSCDIKAASSTTVRTTFIDKLAMQNTGMVSFFSTTMLVGCMFKSVERPYEIVKEIREYQDSLK